LFACQQVNEENDADRKRSSPLTNLNPTLTITSQISPIPVTCTLCDEDMNFSEAFSASDRDKGIYDESIPLQCQGVSKSTNLSADRNTPSPIMTNTPSTNARNRTDNNTSGPTLAIIRFVIIISQ
jgi:hypothetical protein